VAGALPCLAANYAYQHIVQHGQIMSSYTATNIAPSHILGTLPRYLLYLSVLLPGMLVTPLLYRRAGRFTLLLLTYGYVLVYSLSYYTDFTGSKLETLVVSQRYLQAVIPIFVVAYVTTWDTLTKAGTVGAWLRRTTAFLLAAMGIAALGIQARHQAYLQDLAAVRGQVLALTAPEDKLFCNAHVGKLLHPGWGPRRYKIISWTDGTPAALTEQAEREIDAALDECAKTHCPGRVVVAMHSREYRPETANDIAVLEGLTHRYAVQAFTPQNRPGMPRGLVVLYILSRQSGAPALPAAPATEPIQHTAVPE